MAHWLGLLDKAGVPCAPIQDYGEVFNDEHLAARDFFWDAPHTKLGTVRQIGSPMRFSETPVRRDTAGPLLGEHTASVLHGLSYDDAEIADLKARGVIGQ